MARRGEYIWEDEHGLWLVLPDGTLEPLRSDSGTHLTGFVEGWSVVDLDLAHPPLRLLNFRGPDAVQAAWILDAENRRRGDAFGSLDADVQAPLRRSIASAFRVVLDAICAWPEEDPSTALAVLERLDPVLRTDALFGSLDMLLPPAAVHAVEDCPEEFLIPGSRGGNLLLQRDHVVYGLAEGLQARLVDAGVDGSFSWPSPIDGHPLRCQGSVCLDDFRFMYKFADRNADLCFFVIASDHHCQALALYFPHAGVVVAAKAADARLLDALFPRGVDHWLLQHCIQHHAAIVAYLGAGPKTLVSLFRGPNDLHLGHQIWNELSGIQSFLERGGSATPNWCIPSRATPIEVWGNVGAIFPEIADRIDRSLDGYGALPFEVYSRNWCAVRITADYVSSALRERLLTQPVVRGARNQAKRKLKTFRPGDAPVIVIGLRVENRTVTDLDQFCFEIAEFVAERWPGTVLVFDGHNAHSDDGAEVMHIRSHGELTASSRPVDVEAELVANLRKRMADKAVTIHDTIGRPLTDSLAWTAVSDCFVAIWGAGLAKLCWACRKPGVIITSRANLESRDDLHIYDAPRFSEQPAPVRWVHPHWVVDMPDAEQLVPVAPGNPFFRNFWISPDPLHHLIAEVVSESLVVRRL